ncbi:hypothetical protein ACRRTK_018077 [Alexandromys fortis]
MAMVSIHYANPSETIIALPTAVDIKVQRDTLSHNRVLRNSVYLLYQNTNLWEYWTCKIITLEAEHIVTLIESVKAKRIQQALLPGSVCVRGAGAAALDLQGGAGASPFLTPVFVIIKNMGGHQRRPEPDTHGTSGGRNRTHTAAAGDPGEELLPKDASGKIIFDVVDIHDT